MVNFFIQAAEGLQAAFTENIIHRDIKPQNLMLDFNNVVKILDFGLAKILWDESSKSVEGTILGTPYYMSPEMAAGRPIDHRGDIFSLGATFYHLLARRPPFEADTPLGIMMKIATSAPMPLYLSNPRISHHLWEIIERTLEKDPNDRYQNYGDLINDLKQELLSLRHKERDMVETPVTHNPPASAPEAVISESSPPGKEREKEADAEKINILKRDSPSLKRAIVAKVEKPSKSSWRTTAFLLALFLVLFGLIALLFSFYQSLMLPSKDPQAKSNFITRLVNQIVTMTLKGKQTSGEETISEYERGLRTFTRMKSIYNAILLYISKEHSEPKNLGELVEKKYLSSETIKDGWGNEIIYVHSFNRLIAPGSDGKADTSDDFVMGSDGKFSNLPEDFMLQTLEKEESLSRR
ncbi:MAG: serine/threonine protein kinase [Candidatus Sumerlaeia bacterium]|nr:serine/threonine protein kinase [Candidatus Sumerlaeia bacterium]